MIGPVCVSEPCSLAFTVWRAEGQLYVVGWMFSVIEVQVLFVSLPEKVCLDSEVRCCAKSVEPLLSN